MSIKVRCKACGREYTVSDKYAGRMLRCKTENCREYMHVPQLLVNRAFKKCPNCNSKMKLKTDVCVYCGLDLRTGEFVPQVDEPKPIVIDHETQTIDEDEDDNQIPRAQVIQPSSEVTITISHHSSQARHRQDRPSYRNRRLNYALPKKNNKILVVILILIIVIAIGIFAYIYVNDTVTESKLVGSWQWNNYDSRIVFKYNSDNTFSCYISDVYGNTTASMAGTWSVSGDIITERVKSGSGLLQAASFTQQRRIVDLSENKFEGILINGNHFIWYKY